MAMHPERMNNLNKKRSWNESNQQGANRNDNYYVQNNEQPLKRQRLNDLSNNSELQSIAAPSNDQRLIAAHYGNRSDGQLQTRERSSIIQLRKINNWVKSVLISMFAHPQSIVLDIAGGKGGDLNKWNFQKIAELVHVDHAIGSIMDCKNRYNEGLQKNKFHFKLKLVCADAFARLISDTLDNDIYFDVVSSQFALHYAFETEQRVKAMLLNATQRLREDGYFIGTIPDANVLVSKWRNKNPGIHEFGNTKYHVRFKCDSDDMANKKKLNALNEDKNNAYAIRYMFNLNDAVDCPEYLLHFDGFVALAAQEPYNLELVLDCNFHEFFARNYDVPAYQKILKNIKLVNERGFGSIYNDQWEIAYLYKVFVFKKKNVKNEKYPQRARRAPSNITDNDIVVCQ